MLMSEALNIILKGLNPPVDPKGYMVSYEKAENRMLYSGYFPDKDAGDTLINTEEIAWIVAKAFAEKSWRKYVNIYVVDSHFHPVHNYEDRLIKNR